MRQDFELETGQVFADTDPRAEGRTLRIESFTAAQDNEELIALCTVLTMPHHIQQEIDAGVSRKDTRGSIVKIRVRRFMTHKVGGYRLLGKQDRNGNLHKVK